MRIRKRFLSLSAAITGPPPSDLDAGNHHQPPLLVQHQELHPNDNQPAKLSDPPPNQYDRRIPPSLSDYTTQIGLQTSTWLSSGAGSDLNKTKELESEKMKEIIKTDDTGRKESILSAEANNHDLGWIEGDRLIPIKKRRGSFGKKPNHDHKEDSETIEGVMNPNLNLNPNKNEKCMAKKNKKNVNRGNVILEGSRCSRVNGRGWRCGQQTLVGYSLCEHHLGKGRVRSTTSVSNRAQKVALKEQERKDKDVGTTSIDDHEIEDDDDDDDWEVESMFSADGTKKFGKKKKLGVVKARSLSSLLSQIDS